MEFDFKSIPLTLDSLDDVPENFKQFYDQDGEGYKWTDLAPLKNAHARVKRERDEYKAKADSLDGWSALGDSPDAVQKKIGDLQKAIDAANSNDAAAELQSAKEQLVAQHEAEKKTWKTELETVKADADSKSQRFYRTLAEKEAISAITDAKGEPALLTHLVAPHLTIVEDGSTYKTKVLQEDGKTTRVRADGEDMSAKDLVMQLREDPKFQGAFQSTQRTGGGATASGANGGAGKSMTRSEFDAMSAADRAARMTDGYKVVDA